jgi:hypothetical protein
LDSERLALAVPRFFDTSHVLIYIYLLSLYKEGSKESPKSDVTKRLKCRDTMYKAFNVVLSIFLQFVAFQ